MQESIIAQWCYNSSMKVATAREMKDIDARTIQEYGISGLVLMERAGHAVTCRIRELFGRRKVIVISGNGNNGGDGLVVARHLHNEGWDVTVFLASASQALSSDTLVQYKAAGKFGVPVRPIEDLFMHRQTILRGHALIIDAVLGTGMNKPVTGRMSDIVNMINEAGLPVLSIDIPTGISSDNGQILGNAVRASCTVTFGLPKRGHYLYPGAAYTGKLFIEDIGFPRALITSGDLPVEYLEKSSVSGLVPLRDAYSHKGHYGHVLIIAGSRGKTGAARMAAKACLRSGAGLVTVGVPESLAGVFQSCFTEEMTLVLPDKGNGTLSSKASREILDFIQKTAQVVSIGPGISVSNDTKKILQAVIQESLCPVIIDADGINSLRGNRKVLKHAKAPIILTPHPGEMKNLLYDPDVGSSEIEKDRVHTAFSFAKETSAYLVLKGVPTVVAAPDGRVFINSTGNPGMATAGSGDVLTGMISGFLGQTREPLHASILGVYLHGLAGDIVASLKGQHSIIATDLIDEIPSALHSLISRE